LAYSLLGPIEKSGREGPDEGGGRSITTHAKTRRQISYRDLGLACSSAVLLILSFPKLDLSPLAWVGLVPLLLALEGKGLKEGFLLAYITGLAFIAGVFSWIWSLESFKLLDYLLLGVLYVPQYVSLWGLGLIWIRRRTGLTTAFVAPPLWVTLEYMRSHAGFLSLPWGLLGHSQYQYPPLMQIASLTGVYGLSFLIVLMNAAVAEAISYRRQRSPGTITASALQRSPLLALMVASLLLIATALYGLFVLSRGLTGERLTVALVQGNIPQERKWDSAYRQTILDRYAGLTRQAAQQAPALIVWPETAVPGDVQHVPELQQKVGQLAIDTKSYLLVGSAEHAKFTNRQLRGRYYNSMVLLTPEGRIALEYRKIALVPFGEYVPLKDYLTWPKAIVSAMGDFLPGDRYTLFTVGQATFGAVICWETIFPDLFREFVKRGARFMVNGTNEAWFGQTAASHQLLAMTAFRAAENRVAILRAANTGISAVIDPLGRITARLRGPDQQELFVEGVLISDILLSREKTFYTQYGDMFALLQLAVCAVLLLSAWLPAGIRRKSRLWGSTTSLMDR
jgi:apolipoprotein N-acyltransferase